MKESSRKVRGFLAWAAVFLAVGATPRADLSAQQPPPARYETAAAVSPNGAWLIIGLRRMDRDRIPTGGRPIDTWRPSSHRIFKFTSLAKKPRSFTLSMPSVAGWTPNLESPIVLDDGTVLGIKGESHIAIWDRAGKYKEKEVFAGSGFRASLSVFPGGKGVLISREPYGGQDPLNEVLELKALKLEKPAFLRGLSGRAIAWSEDERYLFAGEAGPGKKQTVKGEDGEEISFTTKAWRLVRIAAATNERTVLAADLSAGRFVAGKDSIVGFAKLPDKSPGFFRLRKSPGVACRAVPSLSGWQPLLSLGEEKFLLESGKAHGIVDFGPGEGAKDPAVNPITLPEHKKVLYTAVGKGLILEIDERNWRLVSLEGKPVWQLPLPE